MRSNSSRKALILAGSILVLIGLLSTSLRKACIQGSCYPSPEQASATSDSFSGSCTTFSATHGETVLFGNNEDFDNSDTYLWTVPSSEESYGGIYFGYLYGRPQGGINEKGLAFDALSLPQTSLNPHPDLPAKGRSDTVFLGKMLSQSATINEAIAFAKAYNWGSSISFQVLLADASGDAVIISAGPDGELAFTHKPTNNGYLAATNFNRAYPENRWDPPPCLRYDKAVEMLEQIASKDDLNVGNFTSILDAVHVEGANQNTLYSNVFDLRNGIIYLYYWHQFDETLTLNVAEQLRNGISPTRLSEFFSPETVAQAEAEYQKHVRSADQLQWLQQNGKLVFGGTIGLFVLLGTLLVIIRRRKQHHAS